MKRIAFYGGSFDPPHKGHLMIAEKLTEIFALDEFVFIPAFHAPHKKRKKPTSAYHRFAMLSLATNDLPKVKVSKMELEAPEKPYTIETLTKLKNDLTDTEIFFVIGADSWAEITTWREWERVLTIVNIIVVTRPTFEIGFLHVTQEIRERIVDLRGDKETGRWGDKETGRQGDKEHKDPKSNKSEIRNPKSEIQNLKSKIEIVQNLKPTIHITDAVQIEISATEIRRKIKEKSLGWHEFVPDEVAKYIEKYDIY